MATIETLDVTKLEARMKHPTVFKYFDALRPGEEFVIENDHDPKPLYYELIGERGNIFTWEYLEKGPEWFIVRICKNPLEEQTEIVRLNVTAIEPKFKHPTIFKYFDALQSGESFIIENDHDPKPLYYELIAERGDIFTWEYLLKGPELFEVKIAKNTSNKIGEEVAGAISIKDIKKAEMLKEKGVQFNCSTEKKYNLVDDPNAGKVAKNPAYDYNQWELDFLVDYIVNTHHSYIKNNAQELNDLAIKIAEHHGDNHPELNRISTVMYHFLQDLIDNIVREEEVLFPVLKQILAKQRNTETEITYKIGSLEEPINLLKKDHEIAAIDLSYFKKLTDDYRLPADACSSYQYFFRKLMEFENNLKIHLDLENDILFPKAILLDAELAQLN
jgi:regulator of cell morphogenesis and NO signaling